VKKVEAAENIKPARDMGDNARPTPLTPTPAADDDRPPAPTS
jgi:hypothetical protein